MTEASVPPLDGEQERRLIAAAVAGQRNAYCPYSRYPVGAAVLTPDGTVFAGANVENASYGLTICAERSAVFAAVSAGHRQIVGVAAITESEPPALPCGACRQVLREFAVPGLSGTIVVILDRFGAVRRRIPLDTLLPDSFGPEALAAE